MLAKIPAARPSGSHALTSLLPFTPTTVRTFSGGERVHALLRVYQGGKRDPVAVTLAARIADRDNRRVHKRTAVLPPTAFATTSRVAESGLTLPLPQLAPGPHLLSIEANDGKATAVRHVRFAVE